MKKAIITLLLFLAALPSFKAAAQNILISDSAACRPNDTVVVSIEIDNSKQFISFQFDLQIPDKVSYIGYSLQLSNRSTNHVAIGNLVGNNTVRILAYSPNNDAFLGSSGKVISFKLAVGNARGVFPLTLSNAIIGDSLSTNILTGIRSGPLSVYPLGIIENQNPATVIKLKVIPNPVKENSMIEVTLKYSSALRVSLVDGLGQSVFNETLGEFPAGVSKIDIPAKLQAAIQPGAIYHLGVEASAPKNHTSIVYTKIVK